MKQSDFLENAENCAQMAEQATDEPTAIDTSAWKLGGGLWLKSKTGSKGKFTHCKSMSMHETPPMKGGVS